MGWLDNLRGSHRQKVRGFIYVKLPLSIMPIERGERFEDPIDAELKRCNLGSVSGGGSLMSEPDADGNRSIVYCGVDVEAVDLDMARALLRDLLPGLGAPDQTALQYEVGDSDFEDLCIDGVWTLGIPQRDAKNGLNS